MLELERVTVHYGAVCALRDVSLRVSAGRITAVVGANGAGKSTCLKVISGLVSPAGGQVYFADRPLLPVPAEGRRALGIAHVLEGRRLFGDQTVEDNLLLGAYSRLTRHRRDQRAVRADMQATLERFPILVERRRQLAATLSGGQQQMLLLAMALVSRPRLLLLDEPSLGLAPRIVQEVFAIIRALRDEGIAILLVEQMASMALSVADDGYVFERGQVVASGPADQLLRADRLSELYLGNGRGAAAVKATTMLTNQYPRWSPAEKKEADGMGETTLVQRLGRFVAGLRYEDLPPEVVEKARVVVLHNLGVAQAGYRGAAIGRNLAAQSAPGADGGASLLVDGTRTSTVDAAFANATLIHARTQDDVHAPASTHVGCTVLPAALAVAEAERRSGRDFVTALVAGYEVAAAVGAGAAQLSTPRGFRATGIYGPIGAAAAAARLRGLDTEGISNAIAIACSMSASTGQTWVDGTREWQLQVGQCARNGILAADMARAGATGSPQAFEGAVGFYHAFVGDRTFAHQVGHNLGATWETLNVTFKPYPVCAINQTPVLVLLRMKEAHRLTPDGIRSVRITLSPYEFGYPGIDNRGPYTDFGGTLMSARFCASVALQYGQPRMDDLFRFDDLNLAALWEKTTVDADQAVDLSSCRIEIATGDGRRLQDDYRATNQTFNFNRDEESALVRSLLPELRLSAQELERFIATALQVDSLDTVAPLLRSTQPGA